MGRPQLIAVMGPSASGKSALAEALADILNARLVNADAFQVYQGFDIGTNKPADRTRYDLLDVCQPTEGFGAGQFVKEAMSVLELAWQQQQSVIVVGGTGFYIRSLFEEFDGLYPPPDPHLRAALMAREQTEGLEALVAELIDAAPDEAARTDLKNPVRVRRALEKHGSASEPIKVRLPPFSRKKVGLFMPIDSLEQSIASRAERQLDSWREEVHQILHREVPMDAPAWRAIGYQSIADWERGSITRSEAKETIIRQTRQYARRQMTWLRAEPGLNWIELNDMAPDWGALAEGALAEWPRH